MLNTKVSRSIFLKSTQPSCYACYACREEIKDPEDKKPSDWVDDSMMDDPEER
jgi:hypothetical protein